MIDWFERITGFRETTYDATRRRLKVVDGRLVNELEGSSRAIGRLQLVSLKTLRERVATESSPATRSTVAIVTGDVREMHRAPAYDRALFQVASQFNLLEMVSPEVTPEHGVTGYRHDRTQGPACAMAAGAATIFRNYLVSIGAEIGQTAQRQLDGLADIGTVLSSALRVPLSTLWQMRNGYALCSETGLFRISAHLADLDEAALDRLGAELRIGLCTDAEVTDSAGPTPATVSQAFCSALPVAYTRIPSAHWRAFATLVLDAAYEATLLAAVLNARRGASNIVLLTSLGGGAFGNETVWILGAMRKALRRAAEFGLDVRIVSHGPPSDELVQLIADSA